VGSLSSLIGKLSYLDYMDLGNTMLSGSIPSEVALLHRLGEILLSNTMLEGTIPEELYVGATSLRGLALDGCQFSGTISTMIGLLTNLLELNLADNNFHGKLPQELSAVSLLTLVRLNGNNFTGTFPEGVCTNLPATMERKIVADCTPNETTGIPPMHCECCTECCDRETEFCQEQ
jgi:kinase